MPLINVKVIEGVFTPAQKTQIAERLTDAMVSIEGENMRQVTWCVIEEVNSDEGVRWLFSFLSADRRRTYCLYEAPSPDAILAAAQRANVPADAVVEVSAATPQFAGRLRDWADAVR